MAVADPSEDIATGGFDQFEIRDDIYDAVNAGCFVLNNSWGGYNYNRVVRGALAFAYKMNCVVIASAGNEATSIAHFPSSYAKVLSVASTTQDDQRSAFSNFGPFVDLAAPGGANTGGVEDIYSTWGTSTSAYNFIAGTSMASPVVTGLVALLKSFDGSLDNDDVTEIIRLSVDEISTDLPIGAGRVNANRAIELLRTPYSIAHSSNLVGGSSVSNSGINMAFFGVPSLPDGQYVGDRHEVQKYIAFGAQYAVVPNVWGRGVYTVGYSAEQPNYAIGWCEPVAGTITKTGCTMRTYVFDLYTPLGVPMGWYPAEPANISLAISVHGIKDLLPPFVEVLGPDGGEQYESGDVISISWIVQDEYAVGTASSVFLVEDLGGGVEAVTDIALNQSVDESGVGSVSWTVPDGNRTVDTHKIRVSTTDTNGHFGTDVSDGFFTIEYTGEGGGHGGGEKEPHPCEAPCPGSQPLGLLQTALLPNTPNPFNPETTIPVVLDQPQSVALRVYDAKGRFVVTLVDGPLTQGEHRIPWAGVDDRGQRVGSGVYLAVLEAGGRKFTRKLVFLK